MVQSLPGIVAISYVECNNLPPQVELKCLAGMPVYLYANREEVAFTGTPTCVTESDYDNNSQSEVTTLTFDSTEDLPVRSKLAFIVTDVQLQRWLIGHYEPPYPTIKRNHHLGTPADNKAGYTYEVKLIGRKTVIMVS